MQSKRNFSIKKKMSFTEWYSISHIPLTSRTLYPTASWIRLDSMHLKANYMNISYTVFKKIESKL